MKNIILIFSILSMLLHRVHLIMRKKISILIKIKSGLMKILLEYGKLRICGIV